MSEKSEGSKPALDLSEFEAEIPPDVDFEAMIEQCRQAKLLQEQYGRTLVNLAQHLLDYERAMGEASLPRKTNADKLKYLSQAYLAAIELEPHGLLPEGDTLGDLQVRIIATKALVGYTP